MTYKQRLSLLAMLDSLIVLLSIYISYFLVSANVMVFADPLIVTSSVALLLGYHLFAFVYNLYKNAWEYASKGELIGIVKAVTLSIVTGVAVQYMAVQEFHVRLMAVTWMILMILIGGSRFCWRLMRNVTRKQEQRSLYKRTLIVGAGSTGTMVARQLLHSPDQDMRPVAFVDDNPHKHGLDVLGVPVVGGTRAIEQVARDYQIELIVIAIPSLV
ncbi:hypothetical protein WJ0W_002019 [Paenibacillus melissococcoides]|uniref:Polysaccharide biosynthesis protein n=1 Tax=Paenibacillus melissococcoides TaxID=2912268 RepID=A0ABN8U3I7_9BACL|nr:MULTISPECIES: hypothetical protein [Paenibacillus]MEB9897675.1 hypothetical protein [Bacillus cereus]CAH8244789.1 hypothetical protein WJ0W_002019 [Paenibacillus melissococcoides]CAH8708979.1 hypothetical protein WDD9_002101 [Paenibacillus melissococcoides]CAH8709733.1 hypothetical protein HTL2_002389 [Paenibacillus melissococcoides]GIO78251.1 hypothetical protein J6TS7_18610 [Paenibacillus dendritiformis]